MINKIVCLLLFCALVGCAHHVDVSPLPDIPEVTVQRADKLDEALKNIVKKHKINTAGIAVIKSGELVWQNQYGWQMEEVMASEKTLFNVASLTKPFTAETILRLVEQGKLHLDESVAEYWQDPDLNQVSELADLTPRMLLNHTSGFANWRYFSEDGKLRFNHPPGSAFGYSGEGFEYLAKYAENKLGRSFPELVAEHVFAPLKLKNAYFRVNKNTFEQIAKPFDKNGKFYGYYCNPYGYCSEEGSYSAAANLVISVTDYANFLIAAMDGKGLSKSLLQDRNTMQGVQFSDDDIACVDHGDIPCPAALGYGLGWSITHFDNDKLIGHRGTNWKSVTLAYYYPSSRDGLVVLFNAPNKAGLAAMVDALELLDPDSPEILGYRLRASRSE